MTIDIIKTYIKLMLKFRNGYEVIRTLRGGPPCDRAILRDGTVLTHPPGQDGMTTVLVDLWINRGFLPPGFYQPGPDDVIIDCGAHVGLFSVLVSRLNPRCRIIAIEPHKVNFQYLKANVKAAGSTNIETYQFAVGQSRGEGWIDDSMENYRTIDYVFRSGPAVEGVEVVPVETLADLFKRAGTERVAFLKVDIEGSEYDLFMNAEPDLLRRFNRIAMEYHDNLRPGTLELLRNRLEPTHILEIIPAAYSCGILLGRLRPEA